MVAALGDKEGARDGGARGGVGEGTRRRRAAALGDGGGIRQPHGVQKRTPGLGLGARRMLLYIGGVLFSGGS